MPVFPRQPAPPPVAGRDQLVDQLAHELERVGEGGEPLIFENPVQPTDKFFVIVVWSAWANIPWVQRRNHSGRLQTPGRRPRRVARQDEQNHHRVRPHLGGGGSARFLSLLDQSQRSPR